MPESIVGLVRHDDNVAAHDGAHKAVTVRSHHKRVALAVYYTTVRPLSAQDVRDRALRLGLVASISSAESVRRRVIELLHDGYLSVVDERGPHGATYALTAHGLPVARAAEEDLVVKADLTAH